MWGWGRGRISVYCHVTPTKPPCHTTISVDFCPCIGKLVQGSADPGWAWQARSVVCGHLRVG